MSVTYQIGPVIDAVRSFVDLQLALAGEPEQPLPLLSSISQYSFDPSICPLLVFDPVATRADWSRYASGDVQLSMELDLHEIRLRSGVAPGEESAAIGVVTSLASAFAQNYRLNGDVQSIEVESISIAAPDTMHRLGIPEDEHSIFAAATMKTRVIWVESCLAAA